MDRLGSGVGPQGIGGGAHDERPAEAVGRLDEGAGAVIGRGPVGGCLRLRFGLPEQFRHLLEGHPPGQLNGRPASVRWTVLPELGDPGRDGGQSGLDLASTPSSLGQALDVGQVEQTPPAVRLRVRLQQAPADVGVQRGHLDAEPPGRLLTLQHPLHPSTLY